MSSNYSGRNQSTKTPITADHDRLKQNALTVLVNLSMGTDRRTSISSRRSLHQIVGFSTKVVAYLELFWVLLASSSNITTTREQENKKTYKQKSLFKVAYFFAVVEQTWSEWQCGRSSKSSNTSALIPVSLMSCVRFNRVHLLSIYPASRSLGRIKQTNYTRDKRRERLRLKTLKAMQERNLLYKYWDLL